MPGAFLLVPAKSSMYGACPASMVIYMAKSRTGSSPRFQKLQCRYHFSKLNLFAIFWIWS